MAIRKSEFQQSKAKKPEYDRTSKMRKYTVFFDQDTENMRLSFYKKVEGSVNVDNNDIIFTVDAAHEHRTDLISVKFYGTAKYDWVIEDVNNIRDPIKDVVAGVKLIIPDKTKIYSAT